MEQYKRKKRDIHLQNFRNLTNRQPFLSFVSCKIPCAVFFIIPAAIVTFIGPKQENITHPRTTTEDYMVAPPWVPFPSTLAYRRHEAEWIAAAFQPNASGVSDVDRLLEMERSCCRLIVLSRGRATTVPAPQQAL
ncbi:Os07g0201800, partial [Oryza sativa Japonica Group]